MSDLEYVATGLLVVALVLICWAFLLDIKAYNRRRSLKLSGSGSIIGGFSLLLLIPTVLGGVPVSGWAVAGLGLLLIGLGIWLLRSSRSRPNDIELFLSQHD